MVHTGEHVRQRYARNDSCVSEIAVLLERIYGAVESRRGSVAALFAWFADIVCGVVDDSARSLDQSCRIAFALSVGTCVFRFLFFASDGG